MDWRLCFVTDRNVCPGGDAAAVAEAACRAGLRAVQYREKSFTTRDMFIQAAALRDITADCGASLFINGRIDIALAVDADGVHAPEADAPALVPLVPRLVGGLVGVSCHSVMAAAEAEAAGVDYVMFGPVYNTPSKSRFGAPQGVAKLESVAANIDIPVVAIGGITPERALECRRAGAAAVAVVSSIATASDVAARVDTFAQTMGEL